jgi:hypothetical protein
LHRFVQKEVLPGASGSLGQLCLDVGRKGEGDSVHVLEQGVKVVI